MTPRNYYAHSFYHYKKVIITALISIGLLTFIVVVYFVFIIACITQVVCGNNAQIRFGFIQQYTSNQKLKEINFEGEGLSIDPGIPYYESWYETNKPIADIKSNFEGMLRASGYSVNDKLSILIILVLLMLILVFAILVQ